jgi:hypothetical protein
MDGDRKEQRNDHQEKLIWGGLLEHGVGDSMLEIEYHGNRRIRTALFFTEGL